MALIKAYCVPDYLDPHRDTEIKKTEHRTCNDTSHASPKLLLPELHTILISIIPNPLDMKPQNLNMRIHSPIAYLEATSLVRDSSTFLNIPDAG